MNSNLLIGLVVGAVVVVGGGYYLLSGGSAPATDTTGAQAGKFKGSLAEMAARGGSWKCTVDSSTGQSVSSGVTYASGGKVRADFKTSVSGYGAVESHMMADGQYVYTWSSVMPQGIKTKMTAGATAGGSAGTASGQSADADQSYSYDCQPWTADASLFVLPASVTFK
ncbi:MAG: hypothetical protein Q7S50_01715 [bacterium]|nr:hypothetical protein [bacterium]